MQRAEQALLQVRRLQREAQRSLAWGLTWLTLLRPEALLLLREQLSTQRPTELRSRLPQALRRQPQDQLQLARQQKLKQKELRRQLLQGEEQLLLAQQLRAQQLPAGPQRRQRP